MAKGDHLYVEGLVGHHGINCGDGTVIHYSASLKGGHGRIMRVSTSEFADRKPIRMEFYNTNYSPDEIVRRAKERLGEQIYHPLGNNCEHFVYWCTTGKSKSYQVENAKSIAILGVMGVTVGLPITAIGGGAIAAGTAIYHGLRMLGNWDNE